MSGISSGVGIVTGIDSASLIDQLIEIERTPILNLESRVGAVDVQRAALLEISAQLLGLQNAGLRFDKPEFFQRFTSTSSDDTVISATASSTAVPGSNTFRVRSLVSNYAAVSRGFADADKSPVGVGTVTVEIGNGRVNQSTHLSALNSGKGVQRGVITITDRAGQTADIDLTAALTLDDVFEAINSNTTINVRARATSIQSGIASGDRIVIEDLNVFTDPNITPGQLSVADKTGGSTASDLGIATSVAGTRIDGSDLIRLANDTPLSVLNNGNGVGRLPQGSNADLTFSSSQFGDFNVSLTGILATQLDTDLRALNSGFGVRLGTIRITDKAGNSVDIDLAKDDASLNPPTVRTAKDLLERINTEAEAAGVLASITIFNSDIQISDDTGFTFETAPNFIVEDISGSAAADLGIAGDVEGALITGRDIYRIETLGEVINAINYASGNNGQVKADISADGNGISLTALGLGNTVTVSAVSGSTSAADLGIDGAVLNAGDPAFDSRSLIAGLNTVTLSSLNGGKGINLGRVSFTDRVNQTTTIDFTSARTLQDVVDLINESGGTSLVASINNAGNGLAIRDQSAGNGSITISDASGTLATDLGIAGAFDASHGNTINGGSAQLQYITGSTLLADYNNGAGVTDGDLLITDSTGFIHAVTIAGVNSVNDLLTTINGQTNGAVEARINDTGDGVVIVDKAGGTQLLKIEDQEGSTTAAELHIAGTSESGQNFIDGSLEIRIKVDAKDTLLDVANKINDATNLSSAIVNDGSTISPFSLTIASKITGTAGELMIDSSGIDLGMETLSKAQDAVISIGSGDSTNPILVTNSSNTFDEVIPGVTLNALATSDEDITIDIAQDVDGIVAEVQSFIDRYNDVQSAIDDSTSFDQDSLERGPLLGDRTVTQVRNRLTRVLSSRFDVPDDSFSRLFSVGIRIGAGNKLEFDDERFREAYEASPDRVAELFTQAETGFGAIIQETVEGLTDEAEGLIPLRNDSLVDQQEILNDRISQLETIIAAKRARLQAEFAGLESVIANLQAQQSALAPLTQLAGT